MTERTRRDNIPVDQPTSDLAVRLALQIGTALDQRISKRRLVAAALRVAASHVDELIEITKETP